MVPVPAQHGGCPGCVGACRASGRTQRCLHTCDHSAGGDSSPGRTASPTFASGTLCSTGLPRRWLDPSPQGQLETLLGVTAWQVRLASSGRRPGCGSAMPGTWAAPADSVRWGCPAPPRPCSPEQPVLRTGRPFLHQCDPDKPQGVSSPALLPSGSCPPSPCTPRCAGPGPSRGGGQVSAPASLPGQWGLRPAHPTSPEGRALSSVSGTRPPTWP